MCFAFVGRYAGQNERGNYGGERVSKGEGNLKDAQYFLW